MLYVNLAFLVRQQLPRVQFMEKCFVDRVVIFSVLSRDYVAMINFTSSMIAISTIVSKKLNTRHRKNSKENASWVMTLLFHHGLTLSLRLISGSALCGNKSCRAKLGLYALLKEHPEHPPVYPLKCKAVKIRQTQNDRNNNPILIKSQWKQIPFHIPTFQETQRETEDIFYDALDYVPSLSD